MAWPASGKLLLRSITSGQVHGVQLLQTREALTFTQQADGLSIQLPAQQVGEHAFALRILGVA
jgi:alpha-L-fucosidase